MRRRILPAFIFIIVIFLSCESPEQKEERLAKKHCSACHTFPQPEMLDKETWEKSVLPEMEFRMGLNFSRMYSIPEGDLKIILPTLPRQPMLTVEEWQAIQNYYLKNAPDTLNINRSVIADTTLPFIVQKIRLPITGNPSGTLISQDTLHNHLYYGTRPGKLYKLSHEFHLLDSFTLTSPPSAMIHPRDQDPLLLTMGIMEPNDQPKGEVVSLNLKTRDLTTILDSLKRPVHFEQVDLNNDGLNDFVICSFGNVTGALQAFEQEKNGGYKKHILQNAGARRVIIKDFDNNGLPDILVLMTQGDEKIILFHNQGNFKFRITTLLRFPPVYGSSYFDIADFNGDGKFDILYTNGDNADFSMILKPYHGVRIFINNGRNQFREEWFYPMHGASKALARDFDNDGDLDIAAISFFPDFETQPEQGFIYFENQGNRYLPKVTKMARSGRWMLMEAIDLENDGATDILLGAMDFHPKVPEALRQQWAKDRIMLLVLKNKSRISGDH